MLARVKRTALVVLMRLPVGVRSWVIRRVAPTYHVGALAFVVHEGQLLLIRIVYRGGWGAPGGLLERGELPEQAAVREVREELGIDITPHPPGVHHVEPSRRSVTIYLPCSLADPAQYEQVSVQSYELDATQWFPLDALPDDLHLEARNGLRWLGLLDGA